MSVTYGEGKTYLPKVPSTYRTVRALTNTGNHHAIILNVLTEESIQAKFPSLAVVAQRLSCYCCTKAGAAKHLPGADECMLFTALHRVPMWLKDGILLAGIELGFGDGNSCLSTSKIEVC